MKVTRIAVGIGLLAAVTVTALGAQLAVAHAQEPAQDPAQEQWTEEQEARQEAEAERAEARAEEEAERAEARADAEAERAEAEAEAAEEAAEAEADAAQEAAEAAAEAAEEAAEAAAQAAAGAHGRRQCCPSSARALVEQCQQQAAVARAQADGSCCRTKQDCAKAGEMAGEIARAVTMNQEYAQALQMAGQEAARAAAKQIKLSKQDYEQARELAQVEAAHARELAGQIRAYTLENGELQALKAEELAELMNSPEMLHSVEELGAVANRLQDPSTHIGQLLHAQAGGSSHRLEERVRALE